MITVKVIRQSSGDPIQGKKVSLKLAHGVTDSEFTDRNGEAHFDNTPANGKVFVDGSTVHEGYLSGRVVVYV